MSRSLVLLSGGMDSAVFLYRAVADRGAGSVDAVFFDWGQRSAPQERAAALALCRAAGVAAPTEITLEFPYDGLLTDADAVVPQDRAHGQIAGGGVAATFFPGRNLVMLAFAFGLAASQGLDRIYFGPNAEDAAGYPDCRRECLTELASACRKGTDSAVELVLPVIGMSKEQVVEAGDALGVPWEETFSCYAPEGGRRCGRCDSCVLRESALGRRA